MKKTTIISNKQSIVNVHLGENTKIFDFVNLYGCTIKDETKIGAFCEIQKNAVIGNRCKISSHTFICEGIIIEDSVFIGHNVTFINDIYPRAVTNKGELKAESDWKICKTLVKKGASIGSGSTVLGGIVIGKNSIVGAGSVVTKNVAPNTIVAGNPAKFIRKVKKNE